MKVKPLTPAQAGKIKLAEIPDFVIQAVNNLLLRNHTKGAITILQKDVVTEILNLAEPKMTRDELFKSGYLNFEPIFRKNSWGVEYDKPAFNETYEAKFIFTPKY